MMRKLKRLALVSTLFLLLMLGNTAGQAQGDHPIYMPWLVRDLPVLTTNAQGHVYDAGVYNGAVAGAQICVGNNCVTSDANGDYHMMGITNGTFVVSAPGYISITVTVNFVPNTTIVQNFTLSRTLSEQGNSFRIVLTWNQDTYWDPARVLYSNLDSELWLKGPFIFTHLYPDFPAPYSGWGDCDSYPYACVQSEAHMGYGPETYYIHSLETAVYYYGVWHPYLGQKGVPPMSGTGAYIQIYKGNSLYHEFTVPSSGSGDLWLVFKIDANGTTQQFTLTPLNCITNKPGDPDHIAPSCP